MGISRGAKRIAALAALTALAAGCDRVAGLFPAAAETSKGAPPSRTMMMGTNLDGLAYWSTALPVLDLMKSAGPWLPQNDGSYDTGEPIPLDADGWVTRLPRPEEGRRYTSALVNVVHDNPAAPPRARYVVLYDGEGQIDTTGGAELVERGANRLVVRAGDQGGLYLRLVATDPAGRGDYVRNIRVVREDLLPLYAAGLTFNPDYLAKIGPFHVLRFMDWMNTNVLFDRDGRVLSGDAIDTAPLLDWRDRVRAGARCWGDGCRGVPVEAMVEIANRVGAEPWFNMPANASDDYVRGFASYVRDHLRPDLRVHVEYSNEVWNGIFPQSRYARAQAQRRFGGEANWIEWYGVRSAEVAMIWKQVFAQPARREAGGGGRVRAVFGTQFGWKGLEADGLDTPHWRGADGTVRRASDYFDDYAITGYYDGTMNTAESAPVVKGWWHDPDGGFARAEAALAERIDGFNAPLYRYHGSAAAKRGLRLVSYESGYGEYTPIAEHANDRYTAFLNALQRRPGFTALETRNYRAFQAAGGTLYMNFGIVGAPNKWGNWSALERVTQARSPRYDALLGWLKRNPPRGPATAFADAAIRRAASAGERLEGTAHGHDVLVGGPGDDSFVLRGGRDVRVAGGGGQDVLVLPGARPAWRFVPEAGAVRVEGPGGSALVSGVARVSFAAGGGGALASLAAPAAMPGQGHARR